MTRFTSTPVDYRRLSMLPHRIANIHPGRREHIHGRIQPIKYPRTRDRFMAAGAVFFMAVLVAAFLALGVN